MVGKDPHRPQGKAKDSEHMSHVAYERGVPRQAPGAKELHERDVATMDDVGKPTHVPALEPIGGQRPRVRSRMDEAQVRRLEREEDSTERD